MKQLKRIVPLTSRFHKILFLLLVISNLGYSQILRNVSSIYGEVLEMDQIDIGIIKENILSNNSKYLFDVFHVRVRNERNDTIILAIVYNLVSDFDSAVHSCGLKIGGVYKFVASEFSPCHSDFPLIYNCNYQTGILRRSKNKINFKAYRKIERIINFFPIDLELWDKLKKLN